MIDTSQQSQPAGGSKRHRSKTKWIIVAAAVLLVLVAGAVAWAVYLQKTAAQLAALDKKIATNKVEAKPKDVCDEKTIAKANGPLTDQDTAALAELAGDITKRDGYNLDADCLYIVLQYAIGQSNADDAKAYLSYYERAYVPGVGLNDAFTSRIVPIETLRENVVFLEENDQTIEEYNAKRDEVMAQGSQRADEIYQQRQKQQ